MSIVAFAQLTNVREDAKPGSSTTNGSPGIKTYIDAFAALVPSEVLALHAALMSFSTKTEEDATSKTNVTIILSDALDTLRLSFVGLIALSLVLYVVPRKMAGKWEKYDWLRMLIAPTAFVGWAMIQRSTIFDAIVPINNFGEIPRTATALFLGVTLGLLSAWLATKADEKQS